MLLQHTRSEEHTSELQSLRHLVCRLLLAKKTKIIRPRHYTSARTHVPWKTTTLNPRALHDALAICGRGFAESPASRNRQMDLSSRLRVPQIIRPLPPSIALPK